MAQEKLRVAFVVGTLGQGGAEKQLVYMAKSLQAIDVDIRVYCLTNHEFYASTLEQTGIPLVWFGQSKHPLLRTLKLLRLLRSFKPHVIQATHTFANLYAIIAAKTVGCVCIGAMRNDLAFTERTLGRITRWLITAPDAIIANSYHAQRDLIDAGLVSAQQAPVLPNVIDFRNFDELSATSLGIPILQAAQDQQQVIAAVVARQVNFKRIDRFITALSLARQQAPNLIGLVAGAGPEREHWQQMAQGVGLLPDGIHFIGQIDTIPALLSRVDFLVLSSDHEGFPNVVLEAMAAHLPIITTPAGDAGVIVRQGESGYIVDFDDTAGMAARMIALSNNPDLRHRLGEAGRQLAEQHYNVAGLGQRLLDTYATVPKYRRLRHL